MPELPEVETTRRGLLAAVKGRQILTVTLNRKDIRTPIPPFFAEVVEGQRILDVRRRAKYLLLDLEGTYSILAHLGMSGSFTVMKTRDYTPRTHDHVIFELSGGFTMVFNDPRRFGVIDLAECGKEEEHLLLKHLGVEPLSVEFTASYLKSKLQKRSGAIKPTLMDQKLVVGVGNIYASESLYLCGIHPETPANQIVNKSAILINAIQQTLRAAITSGGSTLRNYVGVSNQAGNFQHHFHVYERDGELCIRCQSPIRLMMQAGRSTYWCDHCQPIFKNRLKR